MSTADTLMANTDLSAGITSGNFQQLGSYTCTRITSISASTLLLHQCSQLCNPNHLARELLATNVAHNFPAKHHLVVHGVLCMLTMYILGGNMRL